MIYKVDIDIRMDQHRLFDLSISRTHLLLWQSGYTDVALVSGMHGHPGAQYKLTSRRQNKELVILETITSVDAPYQYTAEYSTGNLSFFCKNQFIKVDRDLAKFVVITEVRSRSVLFDIFLRLFSPVARWRGQQALMRFKEFAEKGIAR